MEVTNIEMILGGSVSDIDYRNTIPRLTDEELIHCLKHEFRESGKKRLLKEIKKRGLRP